MKKFIYCYSSNPFSFREKSFYKIRRIVPSISEGITIKVRKNIYSIQSQSIHIRDHYDLEYYLKWCPCMNIIDYYKIVRRLLILKKHEEIHLL